jgi:hypothetical protein
MNNIEYMTRNIALQSLFGWRDFFMARKQYYISSKGEDNV